MEFLKADYTEIWISQPVVPLIQFAHCVRAISSTGLDQVFQDELARELKESLRKFDEIVSWYGSNRPEFCSLIRAAHPGIRFLDALPVPEWRSHAADFFLRQVRGPEGALPRIKIEAEKRSTIAVHPFSGAARKNWPLEKFRQLARCLPMKVEWIAGPEDQLEGSWRSDNLLEVAQRLRSAALYVGNDSGISHLAAATGVPTVALFGATDPQVWAPRGRNVRIVEHAPLLDLTVEQVLSAVTDLISRDTGR